MKIRQKVAMLLATAMVVTAVPAMTMAKSDFSLTNGIITKKKDQHVRVANQEMNLKIEIKDVPQTTVMFFVNLNNAEWNEKDAAGNYIYNSADLTTAPNFAGGVVGEINRNNGSELQVKLNAGTTGYVYIPVDAKLKGGDATIAVDGNGSVISDMAPVVFAKTSEDKATVTAGDAKVLNKRGVIADITIEEPFKGIIEAGKDIKVTLDNTDYEFVTTNNLTAANIELTRGFSGYTVGTSPSNFVTTQGSDAGQILITPSAVSVNAPGRIKLKGLQVALKSNKEVIKDDVIEVTVSGDNITETTLKVAVSQEYGNTLKMKDDKVVEMYAGTKKDVTFSIKENVDDSMIDGRTIEIRSDKAFFAADKVTSSAVLTSLASTIKGKIQVVDVADNGGSVESVKMVVNKDDKVIGFDFTLKASQFRKTDIDEIKFKDIPMYVPVNAEGDVKITADGRVALGDQLEVVALNVKAPITTTSEEITAKVGIKEQVGGKIVIKEADKGILKQGKDLTLTFDGSDSGFKFSDKPTVAVVDGDLKLDLDKMSKSSDGSTITIPVSRASKTASTIEITNFKIYVDRTVPQGKFDVKIDGLAVEPDCQLESVKVKDFINVATANTEDLTTNNGLRKGVASFVIGSDKFVVNGVEATMDAKAYLDPAGRTMVPVRFVANALGIDDANIFYAQKTATIVAGGKTISVTLGDKVAKINGVAAKVMDVAPTMANDRVYVPVGEIANLLSVDATWDGATQTATFTVK